jgi:SAM-dependent methyltransferase
MGKSGRLAERLMNGLRSAAVPVARNLLSPALRGWVKEILNARRVRRNPGRILLVNEILPAYAALGGRILWVGCRLYTMEYAALLERHGGQCWTTDIEITHARWGAAGRHLTWDLLHIDQLLAPGSFDIVLCNGVFGFGVDTREAQLAALRAMAAILKPGGRLLLGWNTDRVADPLTIDFVRSAFVADDPTGGGARIAVPEAAYVYDFLRRKEES